MARKVQGEVVVTLETAQDDLAKAFVAVGESSVAGAKRGEALKRTTETIIAKFTNGVDAVVLVIKPLAAAFMEANPKPEKRAEFKLRRDDPICKAWDDLFRLRISNPLVQVNGALAAAQVPKAVRCNMRGEVTLEEVSTDAKAATIKGLAALLGRMPYSATREGEVDAVVKQWIAAGKLAIEKAAAATAQPAAPVQSELSEFEAFKAWKAAQAAK